MQSASNRQQETLFKEQRNLIALYKKEKAAIQKQQLDKKSQKQKNCLNMKINVNSKSQLKVVCEDIEQKNDFSNNQKYLMNLIKGQLEESSVEECQNLIIKTNQQSNLQNILRGESIKNNLFDLQLQAINILDKSSQLNQSSEGAQFTNKDNYTEIQEEQEKPQQVEKYKNILEIKTNYEDSSKLINIEGSQQSLKVISEESKSALALIKNSETLFGCCNAVHLQIPKSKKIDEVQNILLNSKQQSKQSNLLNISSGAQVSDGIHQEYLVRDQNVISFQITQDAESKKNFGIKDNYQNSGSDILKKPQKSRKDNQSKYKKSSVKDENISFSYQHSPLKKGNLNETISNKENALRIKNYNQQQPQKPKGVTQEASQSQLNQEQSQNQIRNSDQTNKQKSEKQIDPTLQDTLIAQNEANKTQKVTVQNNELVNQPERQAFAPCNQNAIINQVQNSAAQTVANKNQTPPVPQQLLNDTMVFSQKSNLEEYIIGKQIGQGAYAIVRIGLHKPTNQRVAMKIYKKYKLEEPNRRKSVKREIKLMEKMKNKNIIQLHEIIDTTKYVILIMEYVGGGSLHGYLKSKQSRRLEEWDAKRIFKQIVEGINYCHQRCITHRDIKLENLLLDELNDIKIIDFGFSTCVPNDKKIKIFCGTPSYMAPEIVLKTEYCGPPADIWALGVLLFTILSGQFPYRGATDEELYDKICRADYNLPKEVNETLSHAAKDLISKLFEIQADKRLTASQILQHQWLYKVGKDKQKQQEIPIIEQANQNDTVVDQQPFEQCVQNKRSKSDKLDRTTVHTPKIKSSIVDSNYQQNKNEIDKQIHKIVNPFKVGLQEQPCSIKQTQSNIKIQQSNQASQQRASSHNASSNNLALSNKIIELISNRLNYTEQNVREQVCKDLLRLHTQKTAGKSAAPSEKFDCQTSFVGNLYLRLKNEEEEKLKLQQAGLNLENQKQASNKDLFSEQYRDMEKDLRNNQRIDFLKDFKTNKMNQTQNILMKSAISQTSLGMSAYGTNQNNQILSQNCLSLLGNGAQNLAIQPSYIPSLKSLNSNGGGQNTNENVNVSSFSQLQFNNTLTTPFQTQAPQLAINAINFNNTQPLKGYFKNLADSNCLSPSNNSGLVRSIRGDCSDKSMNLNFNQTNIFVTNNNQVYQSGVPLSYERIQNNNQIPQGFQKQKMNEQLKNENPQSLTSQIRIQKQQQEQNQSEIQQVQAIKIINEKQQKSHIKQQQQQLQGQKRSLLVNNYFGNTSESQGTYESQRMEDMKKQYFQKYYYNDQNRNELDYGNFQQNSPNFKER